MATSGSINYNQTRDEIISDALQLIGVLGEGETASANAITFCSSFLNKMIKMWHAQGIHCFTETEGTLFLQTGINEYTISMDTSLDKAGINTIETQLSADASGASLSVDSTTGMTAADNISIALDDGTIHTTTIVSVDSSTALTITSALASAAATDNWVFAYTNKVMKPLMVESARIRNTAGNDNRIKVMGRTEFMRIPNKSSQGNNITALYYSPQRDTGKFYTWPTPTDSNYRIKFSYLRHMEDFDASGNNPDLPQEWLEALTYGLAIRVAPSYGIKISKDFPELLMAAREFKEQLETWDAEEGSIYARPNTECH